MNQKRKPSGSVVIGIVAGLLLVTLLISTTVSSSLAGWLWIAALIVSAGLFAWAWSLRREAWAALGTYAAAATALFVFLIDKVDLSGLIVPALALLAVAAPFYVVWQRDHRQLLALAVAYILVAAIPILLIEAAIDSEAVPITIYVLLAIGVAVYAGYRLNRRPARQ